MKRLRYITLLIIGFSCQLKLAIANPVIVDTDMSFDDWLSLAYIVANNQPIEKILIDNNGAATCKSPNYSSARNAAKILGLGNEYYRTVQLSCGASKATNSNSYPIKFTEIIDNLLGIKLKSKIEVFDPHISAENELYQQLISRNKTDLIMLGTSTILATVLKDHPKIKTKIGKIYMMGGSIYVNGNIYGKPLSRAEWNIYVDPDSFKVVLTSGLDITLFPLDITNSVPIASYDYLYALHNKNSKIAKFYKNVYAKLIGLNFLQMNLAFFWDPLATVAYFYPDIILNSYPLKICVNTKSSNPGVLYTCKDGNIVNVVLNVDVTKFKTYLYKNI